MEPPSIDSTLTPSLFPDLAYDHEEGEDDDEESYQEEASSSDESESSEDVTNNYTNATSYNYDVSRESHVPEEEAKSYYQERSNSYSNDVDPHGGDTLLRPESAITPQKSSSNYRYSVVGGVFGCCYGYTGFAFVFFGVLIAGSVLIKMAMDDDGGSSTPIIVAPTSAPNSEPVISIPTSPTDDPFCADEHFQFDDCLADLGSSQTACKECFYEAKEATEIAASCDRINYHLCTAISENCPTSCRTCAKQFEKWNVCFFNETGTCEVNCATAPEVEPEAVCETQIIQYRRCLDGVGTENAATCVKCVNDAIQKADEQVMCSAFHSDFCTAFGKCTECGGCMDQMEEWMNCMTVNFNKCNAGIDCDKPKEPCDDEMVSYHSCLGSFASADRLELCLGCVRDSFETALGVDSNLCNDIQESFCVGFEECDACGGNGNNGCRDEAETYVSCLVTTNGCSSGVDCARDPDPCGAEINGYQACLAEIGNQDNVTECRNCVNTAVETHLSAECGTFNDGFCTDFQLCNTCKPCTNELNSFVTCRMLNTWDCATGLECTKTGSS
ncbi:hypothetical protein FisN_6Lh203 [Fistulifera solaris]|uniref:Uncharacterized protein n=1 Tax=Fistulifera solaris TaxID=1519565 RepID=A0A1Z5J694_FISSO|nr:hypothetical protein FisN_6Lh203 [Fistulifera solaris]|eukprot:GAX09422.1 hypothetical protein FisN_6Lh203 [Fistulifera solaris]